MAECLKRCGPPTPPSIGSTSAHLSDADFAIAFADEIEKPAHHQARFTLGYS